MPKRTEYPSISIIIITKNVQRSIKKVLDSILVQNYPNKKLEIIVIDGKSTDDTHQIIKDHPLKVRIIQSKFPNDPEACRGFGWPFAKGEVIGFIDSDNYLPNPKWLQKMVKPFSVHPEIVGSECWRFHYKKNDTYLNRYFSLLGSADPVGLYLGKADKLSYISEKWSLYGDITFRSSDYFLVRFRPDRFPTLGSNGFFIRKKLLKEARSDPESYFHIDVPYDLSLLGLNTYSVVKQTIIHDTGVTFISFLKKRVRYMMLHYNERAADRRYKVFDPNRTSDVIRLMLFILFSLTFIQPLYVSIKGYSRKKDWVWFIHPLFCFCITVAYGYAIFSSIIRSK